MVQLIATDVDKLIGKRIQLKRKEKGFSADKLSEYIGLSQQQLSRYERGTNKINVAHLVSIATFLDTPISWFFEDVVNNERFPSKEDEKWHNLSHYQKEKFIDFLNSLDK